MVDKRNNNKGRIELEEIGMFENIFVTMLVIGIILQVMAIHWESWPFNILCIIWFLKLAVDSLNVQHLIVYQPFMLDNTTYINGSYELSTHADFGLSGILLVFAFINIPLAIYYFSGRSLMQRYRGL